ncbi:MAG: S-layer homology domain-containing protein [Moorella sp. (in: firmicutes)]
MPVRRFLLSFLTALVLAFPRTALAAWGDGLFPDAAGHWAAEPINFLGALDIVHGYPDGTCRPDQPLTAVEAVSLLLRSTGYSSAGSTLSRHGGQRPPSASHPSAGANRGTAPALPAGVAWAAGDLALAVEQKILLPDELQEGLLLGPAPRYVVWQLLARSLKTPLQQDALLDFSDAALVPEEARPAAATLAALQIIRGFPDGTLRPLDTITRAEMLALLARMVEDGWLNPTPERRLEGWVQKVKLNTGRAENLSGAAGSRSTRAGSVAAARYLVTISTPTSGSKDYPLAASAAVFNVSLPTPFALENLHVLAVINRQGELAFIKAYEPRQASQLTVTTGTVEKVIRGRGLQLVLRDLNHEVKTYEATWATTVPGGLSALKQGQWVKVELNGAAVWNVEPLKVMKASGTIEAVKGRKLYLDNFDKELGNVFLDWERARISDKDGNQYTDSDGLQAGAKVEITCLDWDKVLEIKIL